MAGVIYSSPDYIRHDLGSRRGGGQLAKQPPHSSGRRSVVRNALIHGEVEGSTAEIRPDHPRLHYAASDAERLQLVLQGL